MDHLLCELTRRRLLQSAIATLFCGAIPSVAGCTSLPQYQPTGTPAGKALYLVHGHVLDVVRGTISRDRTIVIRNGVIESLTDHVPKANSEEILLDLRGKFVIPGLIDAHCHATLSGESTLHPLRLLTTLKQMSRNYVQQIKQGVTTIRDMGAMPEILHHYLEQINSGEFIGPRIVYCNAFTNIYGSHPDIDPAHISIFAPLVMAFTGRPNLWFKNTADLMEKMQQNSTGGVSFIKLTLDKKSLLCGKGNIPIYTNEHLKSIFDYAQKNNLTTAGHIHTKFGFDRAVQYGIGSMEHSLADAVLSDQEIAAMAKKKISIVPTMIIAQMLAAPEAFPELPQKYRTDFIEQEMAIRYAYINDNLEDYTELSIHRQNVAYLENYKKYGCGNLYQNERYMADPEIYFNILLIGPKNLRAMKDAGIVIGCGTDAGVPFEYHGTLWREMEMLGRIGFSNAEVLQCATVNNARIIGMADKIGTLEAGKYGDLVILKENPLQNIETCRQPQLVIKEGRIYEVGNIRLH